MEFMKFNIGTPQNFSFSANFHEELSDQWLFIGWCNFAFQWFLLMPDSVFPSGASDCASCVGVFLEIARALIANPETKLVAPLVFLFNGGEETLLLAAHGFMQHSKWASKVGAFINLESTGPGGPAYLFQHTGHPLTILFWTNDRIFAIVGGNLCVLSSRTRVYSMRHGWSYIPMMYKTFFKLPAIESATLAERNCVQAIYTVWQSTWIYFSRNSGNIASSSQHTEVEQQSRQVNLSAKSL